jgi:hypothetical protein
VQITDTAVWSLFAIVLINTIFIAGLAGALWFVYFKMNEAVQKADPVLQRTTETLGRVEEATAQLQQRVDHVLERTTELVDKVSERVDTTTAIAEEAVTEPLIGAASLMAGINRGLRTYSDRATMKGDGRDV